MNKQLIASAVLIGGFVLATSSAHAQGGFSTLSKVSSTAMTAEQMAKVEGKVHIYRLVEYRGVELSAQAEAATRAAAPKPQGGDFIRSPSREATAFNFLN